MSRKKSGTSTSRAESKSSTRSGKAKRATPAFAVKKADRVVLQKPAPKARGAKAQPPGARTPAPPSEVDVLARAEADIASVVASLNNQMSAAIATMTELAVAHRGRGEAVVRTAPLDRVTAAFQRLVVEVVDEKLAELLPTLIALRNETAQRAGGNGADEFFARGQAMLDQVLAAADVHTYDARRGETFDPLIHIAVGETCDGGLADGAVAELVQAGFRTARGKVISPARVKVNRR